MPISGKRHDPYRKHKFRVTVPGFEHMGFSKVSGLSEETAVSEYREGDEPATPRKLMGRTTYENIVLERGAGPDQDFRNWREEVWLVENGGADEEACRRDIVIQLLDKQGNVVRQWEVTNAWPSKKEVDEFDASADDVLMERIELSHEGVNQTL